MKLSWDQISKTEWQAQLDRVGHAGLRQTWDYGLAMQRYGAKVGRAVIDGVAMAQVVERRGLRLIQQGPVWLEPLEDADKRRVLRRLACCAAITLATPDAPLAGFGLVPLVTAQSRAIWSLDGPDLRAGLSGKWRNRLVKAEREVTPALLKHDKALAFLIGQEAGQRVVNGYRNLPGEMALHWPAPLVIGWRKSGCLQAGMVFLRHGAGASYFLGWASPMARAAFAHGPMLLQAALTLRAQGVRLLDLGDVNTEGGAGLARFKLGTGATPMPQGPTLWVMPS